VYVLAEILAAALACCVFAFVSGWGPLSPLQSRKDYGLTTIEATRMWLTGSPPDRLLRSESDNVEDVVARMQKDGDVEEAK
jgi:hypothetical protein